MKIAVLGGAFDPVHFQHLYVADYCTKFFDEVWLMVCFSHRFNKRMSSPDLRFELCRLATQDHPNIHVSDFEIKHELVDGTYRTLTSLKKFYPKHEFSFIIGQDNADEIHKWKDWNLLLTEYQCVVVPRGGHEERIDTWYTWPAHICLGDYPDFEISELNSTKIRQMFKDGNPLVKEFVPAEVADKVIEAGLYGAKNDEILS